MCNNKNSCDPSMVEQGGLCTSVLSAQDTVTVIALAGQGSEDSPLLLHAPANLTPRRDTTEESCMGSRQHGGREQAPHSPARATRRRTIFLSPRHFLSLLGRHTRQTSHSSQ